MKPATRRYAKGEMRRAEILSVAFAAYASSDRSGPRLRDIAQSAGLTEAGVLHYFESKDHLFVAILEARDRQAAGAHDLRTAAGLWAYLEETLQTPGLVKLFVDMSAAASHPAHPAHAFLARRDRALCPLVQAALGLPAEQSRQLIAAAEGLQLRWLRDPSTPLVRDLQRMAAALRDQA